MWPGVSVRLTLHAATGHHPKRSVRKTGQTDPAYPELASTVFVQTGERQRRRNQPPQQKEKVDRSPAQLGTGACLAELQGL